MKKLMRMFKKEEGQSLVEYALIIGLVAVVLAVSLGALEGAITDQFTAIIGAL